ncbi:hypothetical protein CPC08DRAFT_770204 [Agrocybe pediades]|nr:hypothetical protein CPC08DRAFT_770204 [Agrocybe pediades]
MFNAHPGITKANYVSSDILEAVDHFPTFSVFVHVLGSYGYRNWELMLAFIEEYFLYLYYVKDVTVLDDNFSGNWKAHFLYTYYHLLRDPHHSLRDELFCFHPADLPTFDNCAECTFGKAMCRIIPVDSDSDNISLDIIRISHDLTEGTKQASIFAMSASYCVALLCDEQSAGRDWHLMSETSLKKLFDPKTDTIVPRDTPKKVWRYLFLMDLLPYILPLAGRYEPLVDMCRNESFSSHSHFWPTKRKSAREAIDNYLCRMDQQDGMEM